MKVPRLREWRERRAMTQAELGELAGISQNAVSKMENGVRGAQPRTARRLATALRIDVGELQPAPEVQGDPKALASKLLERRLRSEGVETAWALADDEEVLEEGERLGNKAMRENLIPALRVEQKALGRIAADPDLPQEVRDHADLLAEETLHRALGLLKEARKRERTPEGREELRRARHELLADAG